jgi:hypothetical protein
VYVPTLRLGLHLENQAKRKEQKKMKTGRRERGISWCSPWVLVTQLKRNRGERSQGRSNSGNMAVSMLM